MSSSVLQRSLLDTIAVLENAANHIKYLTDENACLISELAQRIPRQRVVESPTLIDLFCEEEIEEEDEKVQAPQKKRKKTVRRTLDFSE